MLGARLKGERVGFSLPGLCWSILQWVGGRVGAAPTRGAEAAGLSLRGQQGAGRRVPSWQTCHARSAWREPGPRALHSQPRARGSQDTVLPRALPLCVPLVPLRLPPGVPAPSQQWDVSLAFREPSGLPVTFFQETRVKQLPRSAWPGCAGALVLGGSGP